MARPSDVLRIARQLRDVPISSPEGMREHALRCLRSATNADVAVFYTLRRRGENDCFAHPCFDGDREVGEFVVGTEGRPIGRLPALDPAHAPPRARRTFLNLRDIYAPDELERIWLYSEFYEALRVRDQLRLFVFDGRRFVGWFGAFRRGRAAFAPQLKTRLTALVAPAVATLSLADRIERDRDGDETAHLVLDGNGRILYASSSAGAWCSGERAARLESLTTRFDAGSGEADAFWDGHEVRLVRLAGERSVTYLATVTRAQPLVLAPAADLSPRQREVADLAAAGATVPEIAHALGSSAETIRSHLREVYRRLNVASRPDLARVMQLR